MSTKKLKPGIQEIWNTQILVLMHWTLSTRPYSTGTALQLSYAKRISQRVKCGIKPNKRKRERRKRRNLSHDGAIMHIMQKERTKLKQSTYLQKERKRLRWCRRCLYTPPETCCWQLLIQCELIHDRKSKEPN
jgi:hypothetical protein